MVNIEFRGVDLHTHTTSSDGICSPSEVVCMAAEKHLYALAITDHDTSEGIPEALDAGEKYGIEIVCGVEFTVNYEPVAHILGLNLDINNPLLKKYLKKLERTRLKLLIKAIKIVRENGINVNVKSIYSLKGTVTILTLKEYLIEQDFIHTGDWIDNELLIILDEWKVKTLGVKECIELIHACGGVAILAHPMFLSNDYMKIKHMIIDMKADGLDGIEVIHPSHKPDEEILLHGWATELRLLRSGGSDFHGTHDRMYLADGEENSNLFIPYTYLEAMKVYIKC
jgi:PHP domain protein